MFVAIGPIGVEKVCFSTLYTYTAIKQSIDAALAILGFVAPQVVWLIFIICLQRKLCLLYIKLCLVKDSLCCSLCCIVCSACLGKQCWILEVDGCNFCCRKCSAINLDTFNGSVECLACTFGIYTTANVDVCVRVVALYHCWSSNLIGGHETVRVCTRP